MGTEARTGYTFPAASRAGTQKAGGAPTPQSARAQKQRGLCFRLAQSPSPAMPEQGLGASTLPGGKEKGRNARP